MSIWLLTLQAGGLPVALSREDGALALPPLGLMQYIELAHGPWTLEQATRPLGIEAVEWPRSCVWRSITGCAGSMLFVPRVNQPVVIEGTGQSTNPSGWQCDTCGGEEVGGFSVLMREWHDPGPA